MNDSKEIVESIAEALSVSAADIDRQADLREDLNLGPIELNDLLTTLSQKYEITFEPEDVASLQTVDDLVALVEDNLI